MNHGGMFANILDTYATPDKSFQATRTIGNVTRVAAPL